MTELTKRQRVDVALRGEAVDRLPVTAWRHFIPEERSATQLAAAHLQFLRTYDWDWLKINPRATCYAEVWGARYDYDDYTGVLPRLIETPVRGPADLARLSVHSPDHAVLGEQIELVRRIRDGIGDIHAIQTIFSPLSVLAFLLARPGDQVADLGLESDFARLRALLREQPAAVHAALTSITQTLASYAQASVAAGASGIFFAIVRLARAGILTTEEYATFGRPYDLQVLESIQDAPFNLLHICGSQVFFDHVLDYPVHAINWAAIGQGNPTLAEARGRTNKALIGGVDEHGTLQHGTPPEVIAEANSTLGCAGQIGILLAPGCGVAHDAPDANLRALRQAVELVHSPRENP